MTIWLKENGVKYNECRHILISAGGQQIELFLVL